MKVRYVVTCQREIDDYGPLVSEGFYFPSIEEVVIFVKTEVASASWEKIFVEKQIVEDLTEDLFTELGLVMPEYVPWYNKPEAQEALESWQEDLSGKVKRQAK